jgi:nucleoside-diphosphate-sugar epimerase
MLSIMGITGRVGGAIAENLSAQGEQIRGIVRNPEKAARWSGRGAEIAVADVWSARVEVCQWRREILDKESIWDEAKSTSLSRWSTCCGRSKWQ